MEEGRKEQMELEKGGSDKSEISEEMKEVMWARKGSTPLVSIAFGPPDLDSVNTKEGEMMNIS
jgi:hypothetical protein